MGTVVCFGEVMLRLTPPDNMRYSQTKSFDMAFGGAENNVAVSLACFGERSRMVTRVRLTLSPMCSCSRCARWAWTPALYCAEASAWHILRREGRVAATHAGDI